MWDVAQDTILHERGAAGIDMLIAIQVARWRETVKQEACEAKG